MRKIVLDCPAKLNLFLEILGRREAGYHEIATVMVPIDLSDRIEVREARRFSLEVIGPVPRGVNTVTRAWRAVRRRSRIPGARIRLLKRIPAGSGLGGGSSDAAAAIAALDEVYRLGIDREEIGAEVGSDVNFFLQRGPALCTGRGELVAPIPRGPRLHAVVAWPGLPLATAVVYRRAKEFLTAGRKNVIDFLNSYASGDMSSLGRALFNRLETAAFAIRPEIARLVGRLRRTSAAGARMTGSGSAVFGLCGSRAEAERMARRFREETRVFAVAASTLPRGSTWRSPKSASS